MEKSLSSKNSHNICDLTIFGLSYCITKGSQRIRFTLTAEGKERRSLASDLGLVKITDCDIINSNQNKNNGQDKLVLAMSKSLVFEKPSRVDARTRQFNLDIPYL
jgi:hypothetical protein